MQAEADERILALLKKEFPNAAVHTGWSPYNRGDDRGGTLYKVNLVLGPTAHFHASFTVYTNNPNLYMEMIDIQERDATRENKFRKLGLGKRFIQTLGAVADLMQAPHIYLSADQVGAYVWPRMGFVLREEDMAGLQKSLASRIDALAMPEEDRQALRLIVQQGDPKMLWHLADSAYGKELLPGYSYEMEIDWAHDTEAKQRFYEHAVLTPEQHAAGNAIFGKPQEQAR